MPETSQDPTTAIGLAVQAGLILDGDPDAYVELRALHPRIRNQTRRGWYRLGQLADLERRAAGLAPSYNVWIGAAARSCHGGGKAEHVAFTANAWVDADTPLSVEALRAYRPRPTLVVRTSTLDGEHLHAYWKLDRRLVGDEIDATNRRLAGCLGADAGSCDRAHVLRAAGTVNHKRAEPEPVETIFYSGEVHATDDLLGKLPAAPVRRETEPWSVPDELVAVGERYVAVRGLIGLLSDRGVREPALMAMAEAFLEHGVTHDPSKPIDLAPVRAIVDDFARADRAARSSYVAAWGVHGFGRSRR